MRLSMMFVVAVVLFACGSFCSAAEGSKPKYDMSPYKALAEEALKLIASKEYPAAEKKIVECEDKFDAGTTKLKAADRKVWTVIDKQMDVAIDAVKAAKDAASAKKATDEINKFITHLADADKVK